MSRVVVKILWICGVLKHASVAQQLFPSRDSIFTSNPSPWQSKAEGYPVFKGQPYSIPHWPRLHCEIFLSQNKEKINCSQKFSRAKGSLIINKFNIFFNKLNKFSKEK